MNDKERLRIKYHLSLTKKELNEYRNKLKHTWKSEKNMQKMIDLIEDDTQ